MLTPAGTVRKLTFLAFLILLSGRSEYAQQAPRTAGPESAKPSALPAAYDIVSLKPHKKDPSDTFSGWRYTASGIAGSDVSVRGLIMAAYHLVMLDQISGLPSWVDRDTFDVEAKLDPDSAEALAKLSSESRDAQNTLMLRALLEDRFKLKVSHSTKELPVYDFVIAKGGPKLREASSSESSGYNVNVGSTCSLKSESIDVSGLASGLSNFAGRFIVDRTGLKGRYEVTLSWAFNDRFPDAGPSLFTALQEQLGLKLEPSKAPLDVVVIDHIERPSEN